MLMWLRPAGIASITSLVEHALLRGALHVDDRRLAGDGDRLLERADAQVGVDRRGERTQSARCPRAGRSKPVRVNVTV